MNILSRKVTCNVLVKSGSKTFGYVSPIWNGYGEYGTLQSSKPGALRVEITYSSTSPSKLNGIAVNGPDSRFPMFGAAMGFSTNDTDFKTGSLNYAYIVGTTQTSPGSPAKLGPNSFTAKTQFDVPIESAIWEYKPTTGSLTARWINSDSSSAPAYIMYAADEKTLFIAGDPSAFSDATSTSYPQVTFTCV
ncbi:hypothetical protein RhiJN_08610 [Ceratobasidium sp. AG-Ba]|nr:hypothetical protein RhiJN_08610 [Ceratobasidium sp. AG-Ba]QRW09395.1 hypothetical protein RhiLY_08394 [Ceratobasidium sp. AG-Ba]